MRAVNPSVVSVTVAPSRLKRGAGEGLGVGGAAEGAADLVEQLRRRRRA